MISKFGEGGWEGFEILPYKDVPGSHQGVIRQNLLKDSDPDFEVRYFEVAPSGFTSFEQHEHEHFVVVMRGHGTVRLGEETREIGEKDLVRVSPSVPHQFRNNGVEPLGILCVVDRVRDRPRLLDPGEAAEPSKISL